MTRDQIFELVEDIRNKAAKDARTRRIANSHWLTTFSNGAYCAFDEAALCILDAAKLRLGDYHAWRRQHD